MATSNPSRALRSCRPRTESALTRCMRRALGPYRVSRAGASAPVSPSAELSSHCSPSSSGAPGSSALSSFGLSGRGSGTNVGLEVSFTLQVSGRGVG